MLCTSDASSMQCISCGLSSPFATPTWLKGVAIARRGVTTVPPPMPSSPEATPAVAPVTPNTMLVVHDISFSPATAVLYMCDRSKGLSAPDGAWLGGGGPGGVGCCSKVKVGCRFWNKTDCNHHCANTFCCSGCYVMFC